MSQQGFRVPPVRFDGSMWVFVILVSGYLLFMWGRSIWGPGARSTERSATEQSAPAPPSDKTAGSQDYTGSPLKLDQLLPAPNPAHELIRHTCLRLGYWEEHEQAAWVAYELDVADQQDDIRRKENPFKEDFSVSTRSASPADYRNSGYDRGHLAPAGDSKQSLQCFYESFLMSNVSPQSRELNTGMWRRIEEKVRQWAKVYGVLYVVTGPVIGKATDRIGTNRVTVPEAYYKVIYAPQKQGDRMIAFICPNKPLKGSMETYTVTTRAVERSTGLDLFHQLPPAKQDSLENQWSNKSWF